MRRRLSLKRFLRDGLHAAGALRPRRDVRVAAGGSGRDQRFWRPHQAGKDRCAKILQSRGVVRTSIRTEANRMGRLLGTCLVVFTTTIPSGRSVPASTGIWLLTPFGSPALAQVDGQSEFSPDGPILPPLCVLLGLTCATAEGLGAPHDRNRSPIGIGLYEESAGPGGSYGKGASATNSVEESARHQGTRGDYQLADPTRQFPSDPAFCCASRLSCCADTPDN